MSKKYKADTLIGRKFGKLLVTGTRMKKFTRQNYRACVCLCDCGVEKEILYTNLLSERPIVSCGCGPKGRNLKHGASFSAEYLVLRGMLRRCRNPKELSYHRYGGRGISVCDRWANKVDGFKNFLADMGKRPSDIHQIDRRNNDGDYTPDNCHWVTPAINRRNCCNTVNLTHNGRTMCQSDWARELGIGIVTLHKRLKLGWSTEKALTTPVG